MIHPIFGDFIPIDRERLEDARASGAKNGIRCKDRRDIDGAARYSAGVIGGCDIELFSHNDMSDSAEAARIYTSAYCDAFKEAAGREQARIKDIADTEAHSAGRLLVYGFLFCAALLFGVFGSLNNGVEHFYHRTFWVNLISIEALIFIVSLTGFQFGQAFERRPYLSHMERQFDFWAMLFIFAMMLGGVVE
jgi:hypothetical protein